MEIDTLDYTSLSSLYDDIELIKEDTPRIVKLLKSIYLSTNFTIHNDSDLNNIYKLQEVAILKTVDLYVAENNITNIIDLMVEIRNYFNNIPKSKTAKLVRTILEKASKINNNTELIKLYNQSIEWCKTEKRTFLRQRIEAKLVNIYLNNNDIKNALKILDNLLREVKKLDDKLLLVELHMLESSCYLAVHNLAKAKAALTSARANSNAIYCPPLLQAEIDSQAGSLCAEEGDYKTGFSYFYESFEGYNSLDMPNEAIKSLKYMLLCKIMTNHTSDVHAIINGKAGVKYVGSEINAMRSLAQAHKERSIKSFQENIVQYKKELEDDSIIKSHIKNLYENLLEQNLLRIVEPFSRVQIVHVAELIDLPLRVVELKLSSMILDKKLNGILDQGAGDLLLFDETTSDKSYDTALLTIQELGVVVDRLNARSKNIN